MNKSGYIIIKEGPHKVGLRDDEGREIVPCRYDDILDYDDDGYIRIIKNGFYSTIDVQGSPRISFARRITHLGVFHGGTARARRNNKWGLVDEDGNMVTKFTFRNICAHHGGGYSAEDARGKHGSLTEDGVFKVYGGGRAVKARNEYFDTDNFIRTLDNYIRYSRKVMHFYYIDTDAPVDVSAIYKVGSIIRAGRFIDVPDNLLRPVTKLRFLIASDSLLSAETVCRLTNNPEAEKYRGTIICPGTCFLVRDVCMQAGVTQVLLLHLPKGALKLAHKYNADLSKLDIRVWHDMTISDAARLDLSKKLSDVVHGKSLSDYWIKMMYQPVGMDSDMNLLPLETDGGCNEGGDVKELETYLEKCQDDEERLWKETRFLREKEQ